MNLSSAQPETVQGDIPFNRLFAKDGEILWPLGAPTDGDLASKKQAADQAITKVVREYAQGGNAPVRDVVAARRALSNYAVPAADKLKDNQDDYDDWVNWVSSLDRGLRTIAQSGEGRGGRTAASPAEGLDIEIKPDTAPKTAGEVLKEKLQAETKSPGTKGETPKSPRR